MWSEKKKCPFSSIPGFRFFPMLEIENLETSESFLLLQIFIVSIALSMGKIKVGLSTSKKIYVICVTESPLKMMKNAFYSILKAFFVLKIFKFLSQLFGHVGKTA